MLEYYKVQARVLATGAETEIEIAADEGVTSQDIVLETTFGGQRLQGRAYGYLEAFQQLRDQLLQRGLGLLCLGSRVNVIQSAMAAATPKVYQLELGCQTSRQNLGSLYDYAEPDSFPDTAAQTAWQQRWLKSLGRG